MVVNRKCEVVQCYAWIETFGRKLLCTVSRFKWFLRMRCKAWLRHRSILGTETYSVYHLQCNNYHVKLIPLQKHFLELFDKVSIANDLQQLICHLVSSTVLRWSLRIDILVCRYTLLRRASDPGPPYGHVHTRLAVASHVVYDYKHYHTQAWP